MFSRAPTKFNVAIHGESVNTFGVILAWGVLIKCCFFDQMHGGAAFRFALLVLAINRQENKYDNRRYQSVPAQDLCAPQAGTYTYIIQSQPVDIYIKGDNAVVQVPNQAVKEWIHCFHINFWPLPSMRLSSGSMPIYGSLPRSPRRRMTNAGIAKNDIALLHALLADLKRKLEQLVDQPLG